MGKSVQNRVKRELYADCWRANREATAIAANLPEDSYTIYTDGSRLKANKAEGAMPSDTAKLWRGVDQSEER